MRPGPVVVVGVRVQDVLQVTPAEDQHVVEALSSNGADPTLRERVRPGCPDGRLHDAEALGPEDLVERPGELGVPVLMRNSSSWTRPVTDRFGACG
jgi:hypothetical protein